MRSAPEEQSRTRTDMVLQTEPMIGGQRSVLLSRGRSGDGSQPQFLSVTLLPGRGMSVLQITAWIPHKGITELLVSPNADQASTLVNDPHAAFDFGGAFAVPFAGIVPSDSLHNRKRTENEWRGQRIELRGDDTRDGFIRDEQTSTIETSKTADGNEVTGVLHAGDWNGQWPSKTDVAVRVELTGSTVDLSVTATNTGDREEPMGIGWRGYFQLPSGDRTQALISIPASSYFEVNPESNLPTGKFLRASGPLNFTNPHGNLLPEGMLDDTFAGFIRGDDGSATVRLIDPKANYGLELTTLSQEIQSIEAYSPPGQSFVALTPKFNFSDPFGSQWHDRDSGLVTLKPKQSVSWHVRLGLFIPKSH
jgi:galactose mutarotase-like enzyme